MILGQKVTSYPDLYDSSAVTLLVPIARGPQRAHLSLPEFHGCDWWGHYEFSWLDASTGWPTHCFLQLEIPAQSPFIIESKSLKLYLGSFANSLMSQEQVIQTITTDLSAHAQAPVTARLIAFSDPIFAQTDTRHLSAPWQDLNALDLSCDTYDYDPSLLEFGKKDLHDEPSLRYFVFRAFRSNCLVTGQPDWAHVAITTNASTLCENSLLRYLTSFRQHQEFHEHCVERIFSDLFLKYRPSILTVYGAFFRRGSLDINPIRSLTPITEHWSRLAYH